MKRILSLAMYLLVAAIPSAFAESTSYEVMPDKPDEGGFHFDIAAKAVAGGMVEFRVVVTEKKRPFTHPSTASGTVKITHNSNGSISEEIGGGGHDLPQEKKDNTITCVFTVPEKSLDDPDFCFIFTNFVEAVINGKVEQMPDCDIFYARLKDYYKKQP